MAGRLQNEAKKVAKSQKASRICTKKKKRHRNESYSFFFFRVLKQGIPRQRYLTMMNSFVYDVFESMAAEASRLVH
ncbi:unnamed protein product [Heligmosomoides polygyrus]|uniref:Histone domain-containing protein n=1 Tax=Heligmosomoides polygyrus TaxID=6339 RepID=A0A183FDV6_HELPZ|nr:unnamed protein product [Heligmosomoides polygyrus]